MNPFMAASARKNYRIVSGSCGAWSLEPGACIAEIAQQDVRRHEVNTGHPRARSEIERGFIKCHLSSLKTEWSTSSIQGLGLNSPHPLAPYLFSHLTIDCGIISSYVCDISSFHDSLRIFLCPSRVNTHQIAIIVIATWSFPTPLIKRETNPARQTPTTKS